jgi:hypothetical protein
VIHQDAYNQASTDLGARPPRAEELRGWIERCRTAVEADEGFACTVFARAAANLGLDWIGDLEPLAVRMAPQIYPAHRRNADLLSAAERSDEEIVDALANPRGGLLVTARCMKLTTIPLAATKAALHVLSTHVAGGALHRVDVDDNLSLRPRDIRMSDALRSAINSAAPMELEGVRDRTR